MRRLVKSEVMWVSCLIGGFLLLTLWEPIYALIRLPPNTVYTYVHNHPQDYFYHLHVMRQGFDGAWQVTTRMTPEIFSPQFVAPFFLFLGKVARVVPIGMGELYTAARAVGAVSLMVAIYLVIRQVFADRVQRIGAFMVTLSATFWPEISNGRIEVPILVRSIWTELDPLLRLSFVPHHLWSKVMLLWLFLLFLRPGRYQKLLIPMVTVIMGFISPVILVTYLGTVSLWVSGEIGMSRLEHRKIKLTLITTYLSGMLAAAGVAWYHWTLSRSSFPWTTYGPPWENNGLYLISVGMYLQSFGPLLVFAVVGAVTAFRKSPLIRLLVSWVLTGWLLIFVFRPLLPFSNSRYLAGYQWIAVGILAAQGLVWVSTKLKKRWKRVPSFVLLTLVAMMLSVPSWYASLRDVMQKIDANLTNPQIYTPYEIRQALAYLDGLKGRACIVTAPDWLSTMIPAYSSCRSVSGHRLMTWANDIKVYEMNEFFFFAAPLSKKAELLKRYGVTHVVTIAGITGTDFLSLLSSTPVFTAGGLRVYETVKTR